MSIMTYLHFLVYWLLWFFFFNPKGTFGNKYFTFDLWLPYFKTDKHLFILLCKCLYIVNILLCIRNKGCSFTFMITDLFHFIDICHYSTIKNTRNIINDFNSYKILQMLISLFYKYIWKFEHFWKSIS